MVMSPAGVRPKEDRTGEDQQQLKLQTRPLIRQGGPHQQTRTCLKIIKRGEKLVACPRWVPDIKADWPTDCRS